MLSRTICEKCCEYWPHGGGKTWSCINALKSGRDRDGFSGMMKLVNKEYNTEDGPIPEHCIMKFEQMIATAAGEDNAKAQ